MSKRNVPLVKYDTERMNKDIPIENVIELYTGNKASRTKNIHCPSPNHTDKTPSAHIYENGCKCFSCNTWFTPIKLAQECFPELSFPDLCQKLINDFSLNVYHYSNLAEVEAITQAQAENKFHDYFPLSRSEVSFIGIQNPTERRKEVYPIRASEYYGEDIPNGISIYDADGNEKMINCDYSEAVSLGILDPQEDESGRYLSEKYYPKFPTIEELWENDHDSIEDLLISYGTETADHFLDVCQVFRQEIENYENTHTPNEIKQADLLRSAFYKYQTQGIEIKLSPEQEEQITSLFTYENAKTELCVAEENYGRAIEICDKVKVHREEREKARQKEKNNYEFSR